MRNRSMGAVVALLLVLTACAGSTNTPAASDGSSSVATPASAFPQTITDDDGQQVTIGAAPQRIVTFAPSMTEIVFALGLGDRVVGVSGKYDDYPAAAKGIQEVGGAGDFGVDPNIEEVVSLQPDLFLTIAGGDQWKQRLRDLGIPVVTLDATDFPDLLDDIRTLGEITGAADEAASLTSDMQRRADDVAAAVDQAGGPVTCFFEVYYPPLTTIGPDTYIFDLFSAGRMRSRDRFGEDRLPDVVGREARGAEPGGVSGHSGVGQERGRHRRADRIRWDHGGHHGAGGPGGLGSGDTSGPARDRRSGGARRRFAPRNQMTAPGARRFRWTMAVLVLALAGAVLVAVAVGAVWISPWTTLHIFAWKLHLTGRPPGLSRATEVIVLQLRLPRVVLAVLVGAGLGVSGMVFQGLFRNPLADPAVIGVSSGAALGAIVVIVAGGGAAAGGLLVSAAAFGGRSPPRSSSTGSPGWVRPCRWRPCSSRASPSPR